MILPRFGGHGGSGSSAGRCGGRWGRLLHLYDTASLLVSWRQTGRLKKYREKKKLKRDRDDFIVSWRPSN